MEAAWQLARAGVAVVLREMRPLRMTPAHRTGYLAELVCSNSLKSDSPETAAGLLKEEMRRLGSLVLEVAERVRVPGGQALCVDRELFAQEITERITAHPLIAVERGEVERVPSGPAVVATGPLTSDSLARALEEMAGEEHLYFYDAASPVVTGDSVDLDFAFRASRYGKGGEDYLNCPLTEEEYDRFWQALSSAEQAPRRDFDPVPYFEGCLPVEEMARRGRDVLRFGPLKPVGLAPPSPGAEHEPGHVYRGPEKPYAVVQLRPENREGTLWSLVGFQTALRWGEQERVFRLIPALRRAQFVRYGVMHKNLYLYSPALLLPTLQWRERPDLFFAGQITGVEGYVESAATGMVAGLNLARLLKGLSPLTLPPETMIGSLLRYLTTPRASRRDFQPMNANFGLLPPGGERVKGKKARYRWLGQRALGALEAWLEAGGGGQRKALP